MNVGFFIPKSDKPTSLFLYLLELLTDSALFFTTVMLLGAAVGILVLANAVRSVITNLPGFYNWFWLALVGIPLTVGIQVWSSMWSTWPATALFLETGVAVALLLPGIVEWGLARHTAATE